MFVNNQWKLNNYQDDNTKQTNTHFASEDKRNVHIEEIEMKQLKQRVVFYVGAPGFGMSAHSMQNDTKRTRLRLFSAYKLPNNSSRTEL